MKKAVCIIGSARSNGSTAWLSDTLIRGLRESGMEVHRFALGEMDIRYCRGCKKCYEDGKCFQSDDVESIVQEVMTSDLVVIAAPSYWGDVPGQLKTYFDRNTPYGDTNPNRTLTVKKNSRGIAIAVRAGATPRENTVILDFIEHYYGHLGIQPVQRISICETETLEDLLQNHQAEIDQVYELGKNIMQFLPAED